MKNNDERKIIKRQFCIQISEDKLELARQKILAKIGGNLNLKSSEIVEHVLSKFLENDCN